MKLSTFTVLVAASAVVWTFYPAKKSHSGAHEKNAAESGAAASDPAWAATMEPTNESSGDKRDAVQALNPQTPEKQMLLPINAGTGTDSAETSNHKEYILTRIDELYELAADKNPEGLNTILGELTNREAEIREAARGATMAYGSKEAIPKLEEAIAQIEDVKEKAALQEAIEYLNLPRLSEVLGIAGGRRELEKGPVSK